MRLKKLQCLDLHTGIGGFHVAAKRNGRINTMMCSEIDKFNHNHIQNNLGLENAGDINHFGLPQRMHPESELIKNEDVVPVEETGFSSVTMEDFLEGVLEIPNIATSGFPCINISPANLLDDSGINGPQSGLITESLRIFEDLEIPYVMLENSERLNKKGLSYILAELSRMGYTVEWETVSATALGYPHYRHRLYLVAYLEDTQVSKFNIRVFDHLRSAAVYYDERPFKIPLLNESTESNESILNKAVVKDTRSIKLRTRRINGLGNAVIPDIPYYLFNAITYAEFTAKNPEINGITEPMIFEVKDGQIIDKNGLSQTDMPTRGYMKNGKVYSTQKRCTLLNPTKTTYEGLYSTLISRDGNNNFTTRSRLNRPGKLGGLIGEIMKIGANEGGLNPEFCEEFMGFPIGFTEPVL